MKTLPLKISSENKHFKQAPEIKSKMSSGEKVKLAKAAQGFETMLTQLMLKSMTKSTNGLFGEGSNGGEMFDTIFENEIATHITENKGLGIADMIYKKMTGEELSLELLNQKLGKSPVKISDELVSKTNKIKPSLNASQRLAQYEDFINEASQKYGVNKNLVKSIILTESAANEKAVSSANAKGLMQLIDSTAADMGVRDVFNPRQNIEGGTKYISKMLQEYDGDVEKALAAYNAGPGNVNKYNGIPPFKETQNYVTRVMGYLKHMEM